MLAASLDPEQIDNSRCKSVDPEIGEQDHPGRRALEDACREGCGFMADVQARRLVMSADL